MQDALRRAYLAMQGEDVSLAPQLSVPDDVTFDTPSQSEKSDRSRQLTTARGVTASGQPTLMRSVFQRRRLVIGGLIGAALTLVLLLTREGSDAARSAAASASAPVAAEALPAISVAQVTAPSASASAEPRAVTLEELPREAEAAPASKGSRAAPKPAGTKRPAPAAKDPFARRR
jgi:hypothetical protein